MRTQILIQLFDESGLGPIHILELSRALTPAEQSRVLQAMCNFGRTLQLWLEAEKPGGGGSGELNA